VREEIREGSTNGMSEGAVLRRVVHTNNFINAGTRMTSRFGTVCSKSGAHPLARNFFAFRLFVFCLSSLFWLAVPVLREQGMPCGPTTMWTKVGGVHVRVPYAARCYSFWPCAAWRGLLRQQDMIIQDTEHSKEHAEELHSDQQQLPNCDLWGWMSSQCCAF